MPTGYSAFSPTALVDFNEAQGAANGIYISLAEIAKSSIITNSYANKLMTCITNLFVGLRAYFVQRTLFA